MQKCSIVTFIEVDICNRMGPLQLVYSMTLTLHFQCQTFSCYAFVTNKIVQAMGVLSRFASNSTALAVELLLFFSLTLPFLFKDKHCIWFDLQISYNWWETEQTLPSNRQSLNDVIVNVVHRDLDLHFHVNNIWYANIWNEN